MTRDKREKGKRIAAFAGLRSRSLLGFVRRRLASSRSMEITGFTLIELLIVMGIISVLATIAYYKYSAFIDQTKETKAIADIKQIAQLVEEFKELNGRYPGDLSELGKGEFKDPWGRPYYYVPIEEDLTKKHKDQNHRQNRSEKPINTYFDLWSCGADGEYHRQVRAKASRDDIIRAWDGEFIGLGKDIDELDIKKHEKKE